MSTFSYAKIIIKIPTYCCIDISIHSECVHSPSFIFLPPSMNMMSLPFILTVVLSLCLFHLYELLLQTLHCHEFSGSGYFAWGSHESTEASCFSWFFLVPLSAPSYPGLLSSPLCTSFTPQMPSGCDSLSSIGLALSFILPGCPAKILNVFRLTDFSSQVYKDHCHFQ